MRKLLLAFSALFGGIAANAQTVATFDTLHLSKADTFYVNTSGVSLSDQGFDDGLAHFPYYYDTSYGGFPSSGFTYTNMTDTVTGTYMDPYSAKAGSGYNGSAEYLSVSVADTNTKIYLRGAAVGKPVLGFYITNTTYDYNSMRDGDGFAKKFGGSTGNDADWFKVTIHGYHNGVKNADSVEIYLADFTSPDNSKDYILKTWQWVNLLPLGNVDSLSFQLSSSDTGMFGMNTPAFFNMDNFTTYETVSVGKVATSQTAAKVYPNPAKNELFVAVKDDSYDRVYVYDVVGKLITQQLLSGNVTVVNTAAYATGTYILQLAGKEEKATVRFVKD